MKKFFSFFAYFVSALFGGKIKLIGWWGKRPCNAVAIEGNIAYLGYDGYLEILDISNPAKPVRLGKALTPSEVRGVAVTGKYVYVADYITGLRIIDVSNPTKPKEKGFFEIIKIFYQKDSTNEFGPIIYNNALGVAVNGNYAYLVVNNKGLIIIDVSNPAKPKEVGFLKLEMMHLM